MEIGDRIFIIPAHSLKFAGRWGRIVDIKEDDWMPYVIRFEGSSITYRFSRNEFMDEETYLEYLSKHEWCLTRDQKRVRLVNCRSIDDVEVELNGIRVSFPVHFLLPISNCRLCGKETVASVGYFCEDCEYPLPV